MEQPLRARVRAGEPDAFRVLFNDYARKVYNHAFRVTGRWSSAEDVVALTFLEAWRLRAGVNVEGGSLLPWLLGICVNVTRNIARAERRHRAAVSRLPLPAAVPDIADDVASRLDAETTMGAVRAAVSGLNQREREVLALCVWSGLGYREAAEALGVPIGTVRSRLSRARRKLEELAPGPASPAPAAGREPGGPAGQIQGEGRQATPPEGGKTR
jgi:RNA polymerase sigma-70 factor (ECF subfamily)